MLNKGEMNECANKNALLSIMQINLAEKKLKLLETQALKSEFNFRDTHLLEPISVNETRLFNNLWRSVLLGILLGISFVIVLNQFKRHCRN